MSSYGHAFKPRCTAHPERDAVTKDGDSLMCMACTLRAMHIDPSEVTSTTPTHAPTA